MCVGFTFFYQTDKTCETCEEKTVMQSNVCFKVCVIILLTSNIRLRKNL